MDFGIDMRTNNNKESTQEKTNRKIMASAELSVTTTYLHYGGKSHEFHTLTPLNSQQYLQVFNKYDTNGNGTIEKSELDQLVDDLLFLSIAKGKNVKEVKKKLLAEYDSNHDGKLSLTELTKIIPVDNYLALFGMEHKFHIVDFMSIWFHYDTDQSGDLEMNELKPFLFDLLSQKGDKNLTMKAVEEYAELLMEKHDKDHNSKLSMDELLGVLHVEDNFIMHYGKWLNEEEFDKVFDHYDRDSNGIIEDTELFAFIRDLAEMNGQETATPDDIQKFGKTVLDIFGKKENSSISRPELRMIILGR